MEKKPSERLFHLTVEGGINALHNFEGVKEVADRDYDELIELLKEYEAPYIEAKLGDIIYSCLCLGFAEGMRFQHCAEHFINPDNDQF